MGVYLYNKGDSIGFVWKGKSKEIVKGFVTERTKTKNQGFSFVIKNFGVTTINFDDGGIINETVKTYTIQSLNEDIYQNIKEEKIFRNKILLLEF